MNDTKNNDLISSPDKRLSIMSDLEEFAFYGFPYFDEILKEILFTYHTDEYFFGILEGLCLEGLYIYNFILLLVP